MHEVLVNRLGGLSLPRKSVVRLTDRPMTLDVYRGRKTTTTIKRVGFSVFSNATTDFELHFRCFTPPLGGGVGWLILGSTAF